MALFKKFWVLLLLGLPVFLQSIWQKTNQGFPISDGDGGDHFRIAYLIYLSFEEGFIKGLDFFLHTGGKPILFSAFTAPFVPLVKMDSLLPISLSLIVIQAVTALAYFWLFSFRIKPLISALLSSLILTTPFLFSIHTQYMPEVVWHMWFVLFLAAMLRSEKLSKQNLSFFAGLFLVLTILARPIESIVLILPPLTIYFAFIFAPKRISLLSFFSLIVALLPVIISFCSSFYHLNENIAFASIIFSFVVLLFLNKIKRRQFSKAREEGSPDNVRLIMLELFLIPVLFLLSIWMLFYGNHLFFWAFDNSFGSGAKTNDQVNVSKNIFEIFLDVVSVYGPLFLLTLLTAFFVSFITSEKKKRNKLFFVTTLAVAFSLLPMLFAYSFTGTSDMRRIQLAIVLLVVSTSFFIFLDSERPKLVKKLSVVIVYFVVFIQAVSIFAITSKSKVFIEFNNFAVSILGPLTFKAPMLQKHHDADVIKEIKSLGISRAKIAVFSLGLFAEDVLFQPESLRFVTLGIDKSLNFGTMWAYTDYEPYEKVIERLKKNQFQFLLLEDLENPITDPVLRQKRQSHTFFVEDLLKLIRKKGEANLQDLKLLKKFKIKNRFIYFFKIVDVSLTDFQNQSSRIN